MREYQLRQIRTLSDIAIYLKKTKFTNKRVLRLKKEILAHNDRVTALARENGTAALAPTVVRLAKQGTKHSLREDQMLPLSRRGRKLARRYPELLEALKVPHKNASVAAIADAAERMAGALRPYLHFLITGGYPRTCLITLRRDAQALRKHVETGVQSRQIVGHTNRELTKELSLARDTIRELDAVIRSLDDFPKYKFDWTYWNRVGARKGRPSKRRIAARERAAVRDRARDYRGQKTAREWSPGQTY